MPQKPEPPKIAGILETAIYVADLKVAQAFYGEFLGLQSMLDTPRMMAFAVAPGQVLLVFCRGATREDMPTAGGVVPGHHSKGPAHFAFGISDATYDLWRDHLRRSGVVIRSEVTWPAGGRSLYFNDPDGNVLELATPGLWPNW